MEKKSNIPNADFLKRKAKALKKSMGITHTSALDLIVKDYGFKNWKDYTDQKILTAESHNTNEMSEEINNEKLWGEDLYNVFGDDINEDGWLTADWGEIIEANVPKWDADYNDNPEYIDTYGRMYNLEYEESEDGTMIRPIH